MAPLFIALQVVACIAAADLLSGFFHWLEDCYGSPDTPIWGRVVVQPNILHHYDAAHFTKHPWLVSARGPMLLAATGLAVAYPLGLLTWQLALVAALGANANEFHKWSHRSARDNGRLITLLQRTGLLQPPSHHAQHHRGQKNTSYCTVTVYLDPLLDRVRFWPALERIVFLLTRAHRRPDLSLVSGARQAPVCSMPACSSSS